MHAKSGIKLEMQMVNSSHYSTHPRDSSPRLMLAFLIDPLMLQTYGERRGVVGNSVTLFFITHTRPTTLFHTLVAIPNAAGHSSAMRFTCTKRVPSIHWRPWLKNQINKNNYRLISPVCLTSEFTQAVVLIPKLLNSPVKSVNIEFSVLSWICITMFYIYI